jgi:hypothetical protein
VKALVALALSLALIGSLAYLYNRHIHKQEDAVAAFALSEIEKEESACVKQPFNPSEGCSQSKEQLRQYMKTHTVSETMTASIDCIAANGQREFARLDACHQEQQTEEHDWALKYPRQASRRQAAILEEKRSQDEKNMKEQR